MKTKFFIPARHVKYNTRWIKIHRDIFNRLSLFGILSLYAVGEYFCFVAAICCASACSMGYQPFALISL